MCRAARLGVAFRLSEQKSNARRHHQSVIGECAPAPEAHAAPGGVDGRDLIEYALHSRAREVPDGAW